MKEDLKDTRKHKFAQMETAKGDALRRNAGSGK